MSKTSKQEEINQLREFLKKAHADAEKWCSEAGRLENEKHAKVALDKLIEQGHEKNEKRIREREALDLLKLGYVKVETLRDIIHAEYNTESHPSVDITDFTLRLRSTNRVEDVLRAAILVKPKPKYATGGYTGSSADPIGRVHPGCFLPSTPFPAAWDLVPVPRQDVVQLSPADRQLLSDINNSVKIKFPGRDA